MSEAPDEIYLMINLVIIFGLAGACRPEEIMKITIDDIEDKEDLIIVNTEDSKNYSSRFFELCKEINNGYYLNI